MTARDAARLEAGPLTMSESLEWRELAREPVADCKVFSVERSIAASPLDGAQHAFYRIHSQSWAQIVPGHEGRPRRARAPIPARAPGG